MQKLVWRVKLVADFGDGAATEIQMARIEREDWAVPETLGLTLAEGKQLTAAIQAEIVRAQAEVMGECFRYCRHCGSSVSSKGYRRVTFRSLFGNVPLRIRRFVSCQCRDISQKPKSFSVLTLEGGLSPELAYVTAKFAALAPFARVADFLTELLPVGGAINAGTVRNRTRRVGEHIARLRPAGTPDPDIDAVTPAVVIGLDGGYTLIETACFNDVDPEAWLQTASPASPITRSQDSTNCSLGNGKEQRPKPSQRSKRAVIRSRLARNMSSCRSKSTRSTPNSRLGITRTNAADASHRYLALAQSGQRCF